MPKQRRPDWERRAIAALVRLVRYEGAHLSLDGGVTRTDHTPAIQAATKEIVEGQIIPLLRALYTRDRTAATNLARQVNPNLQIEQTDEILPQRPERPQVAAMRWLETLLETEPGNEADQAELDRQSQAMDQSAAFWAGPEGKEARKENDWAIPREEIAATRAARKAARQAEREERRAKEKKVSPPLPEFVLDPESSQVITTRRRH